MRVSAAALLFASTSLFAAAPRVTGGLHSKVRLHVEPAQAKPGNTIYLAFELQLDKGWHTYYKNPGDSGVAPIIKFNNPEVSAGAILYPPPEKIVVQHLTSFGYHDAVVFLIPVTLGAGIKSGTLNVAGKFDYLECRETCLPAGGDFSFALPIGDITQPNPAEAVFFNAAREKLPRPSPFTVLKLSNDRYRFELPVAPAEALVIPDPLGSVDVQQPTLAFEKNLVTLEFNPAKKRSEGLLLSVRDKDQWSHYTVALPQAGEPVLLFFLFAVLGGVLLNFMPCVLPVLSLKAMSLVAKPLPAYGSPPLVKGKGLGAGPWPYTLGVVGAFSAVGGLFLILRASGAAIGWGFQLQNPAFVAAIALLFAAMAMNLFGAFEIRIPALTTRPAIGEVMTGVIAVAAATPCTAPFMATALGAALTLPPALGFLLFPLLGFGMSLPVLLLAAFPRSGKILPKPGAWLTTFKGVLGFMMAGSALWLIWVFGSLTNAAFTLMTAVTVFAFFLYLYGKHQATPARLPVKIVRFTVMALALFFTVRFALAGLTPTNKQASEGQGWRAFTPAARDAELAKHRPVFIDFTADWCLTCKVNEQVAFTEKVMKAFAARGVVLFRADFTNLDDNLANEITRLGRAGVPVYAFYDKAGNLTLLPQVLTEGLMLEEIQNRTN